MITRPASSRLLSARYKLMPKTNTDDLAGGVTESFDTGDEATLSGTPRQIVTEEFVDVLAHEIGDRGVYVTWLKVSNDEDQIPENEDQLEDQFDDRLFEIKRVTFQNGLARVFMVDAV